MEDRYLTEGDINNSVLRRDWDQQMAKTASAESLVRDRNCFLHQSLSTPCLDSIERADGIFLYLESGKSYMDFHGNNVHQLGYNNRFIIERVIDQLNNLHFCPRRYTNRTAIECAELISQLLPPDFNRVLFAPSGALAVSMALKLGRLISGRYKIISTWDSFHGATLDTIAAGGEAQFKKSMGPLMPGVINIPPFMQRGGIFDGDEQKYLEYLEYVIDKEKEIGVLLIETIRNTDVQIPSESYWKAIREICDRNDIILILDEIPISMGRTGTMFAFENFGIVPDILCLGKGLGAGVYPMAAIATKGSYNIGAELSLGHFTYEKSPVGSAATIAAIEFIQQNAILGRVNDLHSLFRDKLFELRSKHPVIEDVRCIGLLGAIEFDNDLSGETSLAESVLYKCLNKGLSFKIANGNTIQLCPPLIISEEELKQAFLIIDQSLCEV